MTLLRKFFRKPPKAEKEPHQPLPLLQYQQMPPLPRHLSLQRVPFVVLDTETTGLDPKHARILSVGAVKVLGQQVSMENTFECLVQQPEAAAGGEEIHGILPPDQHSGMPEDQLLLELLPYLGNAVLVGHHIGFDASLLQQACYRHFYPLRLHNPTIDTAKLALRLEKIKQANYRPSDYSLDSLCHRYGINIPDRHTAAGDALATALLLLRLLSLAHQQGIRVLGELVR